jgi:trk system potassium uptake protein
MTAACALALGAPACRCSMPSATRFDLSLGGISTHDANIGYFDSPMIEFVLMIFMLIAAMNFATHFMALRKGELRAYRRDPEARWMLLLIGASVIGIAVFINSIMSTPLILTRCASPPST